MKIKTSITLSEELIRSIDKIVGNSVNRSQFIENAVREYIELRARKKKDIEDLAILTRKADKLNKEAADVFSYQANL
jgi:metal-responsive CopG/Arc/MetJ family transcriptional regulator